jgi:hypothetical protein
MLDRHTADDMSQVYWLPSAVNPIAILLPDPNLETDPKANYSAAPRLYSLLGLLPDNITL